MLMCVSRRRRYEAEECRYSHNMPVFTRTCTDLARVCTQIYHLRDDDTKHPIIVYLYSGGKELAFTGICMQLTRLFTAPTTTEYIGTRHILWFIDHINTNEQRTIDTIRSDAEYVASSACVN